MRFPAFTLTRVLAVVVCLAGTDDHFAAADPPTIDVPAFDASGEPSSLPEGNAEIVPEQQEAGDNESGADERGATVEDFDDPVSERNFEDDVLRLPVDHLLGDWCGWRTCLEDDGITPSVTFVSDMLGNPVGGERQGFTEADNLGVNVAVDMEKRYGWQGGSLLFSVSQRSGRSLSADYIGNLFTTQQVFGGETFKVVDVAYQQSLGDDDVEFQIGRIAAGDDFLVSPYNYVFVQNGFCGNPVGIFLNAPGMSAYPNATWGTVVQARPIDRGYVMGGLYNGDPSIRDINNHGVDMSIDGPPFAIVEFAYERNQLKNDDGLVGNYKLGAWFDGNDFPNLTGQALSAVNPGLSPTIHQGNYGFYGLFDQVLMRWSAKSEEIQRGMGVVASAVISPDQTISQVPYFFTAGIVARGITADRPRDVAAFGVVFGEFSRDLRQGQRLARQVDPSIGVQSHETALEWTYIFRFRNGAFFLQPDAQYIITPGGTGDIPNALVVGTQVGVNF